MKALKAKNRSEKTAKTKLLCENGKDPFPEKKNAGKKETT
jgi:hypothetical protein